MTRRTLLALTALGLPGARLLTSGTCACEIYRTSSREQLLKVHRRLAQLRPGLYLEAIAADHMPQLLAVYGRVDTSAEIFELRSFRSAPGLDGCEYTGAQRVQCGGKPYATYLFPFESLAARQAWWKARNDAPHDSAGISIFQTLL